MNRSLTTCTHVYLKWPCPHVSFSRGACARNFRKPGMFFLKETRTVTHVKLDVHACVKVSFQPNAMITMTICFHLYKNINMCWCQFCRRCPWESSMHPGMYTHKLEVHGMCLNVIATHAITYTRNLMEELHKLHIRKVYAFNMKSRKLQELIKTLKS